jgi:hypothetical protein
MDVVVGKPNEAAPGLHLWPWRIVPKPENRNSPAQEKSGPGIPGFRVHCLLLVTPADTLETISKLDFVGRALQENPILEGSGGLLRVTLDTIEPEHLAALFLAARLPLTLCLPFVLEASPPT